MIGFQKLKKPNLEENDPNYFEDEDYEDKGTDPFLEFFKDSKAKKPSIEKEIKDIGAKTNVILPRKKSLDDQKIEKKPSYE